MGQAPTWICLFFENCVFFCVVFCCTCFQKKKWIGGGWVRSGQSEFFTDCLIFFNMTRPLSEISFTEWTVHYGATLGDISFTKWTIHYGATLGDISFTEWTIPYGATLGDISFTEWTIPYGATLGDISFTK